MRVAARVEALRKLGFCVGKDSQPKPLWLASHMVSVQAHSGGWGGSGPNICSWELHIVCGCEQGARERATPCGIQHRRLGSGGPSCALCIGHRRPSCVGHGCRDRGVFKARRYGKLRRPGHPREKSVAAPLGASVATRFDMASRRTRLPWASASFPVVFADGLRDSSRGLVSMSMRAHCIRGCSAMPLRSQGL